MTHSPEYIEDDIQRTRDRIEDRLNRLGREISPNRVLGSMIGAKSDSASDVLDAVMAKARANPIATLLVGAGVAGFILNKGGHRNEEPDGRAARQDSHLDPAERIAHNAALLKDKAEDLRDEVRGTVADMQNRASESIADVKARTRDGMSAVSETVSAARSQTKNVARAAEDRLSAAGKEIGDQAHRGRAQADKAMDWVAENPVPAGLMALAVGAAAASILTARKAPERELPSVEEKAREQAGDPETVGSARFDELQEAAETEKLKVGSAAVNNSGSPARTPGQSTATREAPDPVDTDREATDSVADRSVEKKKTGGPAVAGASPVSGNTTQ